MGPGTHTHTEPNSGCNQVFASLWIAHSHVILILLTGTKRRGRACMPVYASRTNALADMQACAQCLQLPAASRNPIDIVLWIVI